MKLSDGSIKLLCAIVPSVITAAVTIGLSCNARIGAKNVASATEQQLQVKISYLAGQLSSSRSRATHLPRMASRSTRVVETPVDTNVVMDTSITKILENADSAARSAKIKVEPSPLAKSFGTKAMVQEIPSLQAIPREGKR